MSALPRICINGREIGPGCPVYIVAEMSANHLHQFDRAVEFIRVMKDIGADAVKLQTYTPDTITLKSDKSIFQIREGLWAERTLYDLYEEAYMPWEWQPKLKALADELGITLFSSAFDSSAVDFLETMEVPAHKVASFELVDIPLIQKMAATGKPLLMSTGMAEFDEINEAVQAARQFGSGQIALLQCTSAYPSPLQDMNLRTISHLAESFGSPVGLSDHSLGYLSVVAAVALGACIIEKHVTLSRSDKGPDSSFSMEPHEFGEMIKAVRDVEKSLGTVRYGAYGNEIESIPFRRSLFVVTDTKAGDLFSVDNVRSIRPGAGLSPRYLQKILGCKAAVDIDKGTPMDWNLVEGCANTRKRGDLARCARCGKDARR